jgi:hypothetical protein
MIAKVPLFDDCSPPVAVRAPHHTLRDLPFQPGDGMLPVGELDDTGPFRADMVEVQDHRVRLATIDAGRGP